MTDQIKQYYDTPAEGDDDLAFLEGFGNAAEEEVIEPQPLELEAPAPAPTPEVSQALQTAGQLAMVGVDSSTPVSRAKDEIDLAANPEQDNKIVNTALGIKAEADAPPITPQQVLEGTGRVAEVVAKAAVQPAISEYEQFNSDLVTEGLGTAAWNLAKNRMTSSFAMKAASTMYGVVEEASNVIDKVMPASLAKDMRYNSGRAWSKERAAQAVKNAKESGDHDAKQRVAEINYMVNGYISEDLSKIGETYAEQTIVEYVQSDDPREQEMARHMTTSLVGNITARRIVEISKETGQSIEVVAAEMSSSLQAEAYSALEARIAKRLDTGPWDYDPLEHEFGFAWLSYKVNEVRDATAEMFLGSKPGSGLAAKIAPTDAKVYAGIATNVLGDFAIAATLGRMAWSSALAVPWSKGSTFTSSLIGALDGVLQVPLERFMEGDGDGDNQMGRLALSFLGTTGLFMATQGMVEKGIRSSYSAIHQKSFYPYLDVSRSYEAIKTMTMAKAATFGDPHSPIAQAWKEFALSQVAKSPHITKQGEMWLIDQHASLVAASEASPRRSMNIFTGEWWSGRDSTDAHKSLKKQFRQSFMGKEGGTNRFDSDVASLQNRLMNPDKLREFMKELTGQDFFAPLPGATNRWDSIPVGRELTGLLGRKAKTGGGVSALGEFVRDAKAPVYGTREYDDFVSTISRLTINDTYDTMIEDSFKGFAKMQFGYSDANPAYKKFAAEYRTHQTEQFEKAIAYAVNPELAKGDVPLDEGLVNLAKLYDPEVHGSLEKFLKLEAEEWMRRDLDMHLLKELGGKTFDPVPIDVGALGRKGASSWSTSDVNIKLGFVLQDDMALPRIDARPLSIIQGALTSPQAYTNAGRALLDNATPGKGAFHSFSDEEAITLLAKATNFDPADGESFTVLQFVDPAAHTLNALDATPLASRQNIGSSPSARRKLEVEDSLPSIAELEIKSEQAKAWESEVGRRHREGPKIEEGDPQASLLDDLTEASKVNREARKALDGEIVIDKKELEKDIALAEIDAENTTAKKFRHKQANLDKDWIRLANKMGDLQFQTGDTPRVKKRLADAREAAAEALQGLKQPEKYEGGRVSKTFTSKNKDRSDRIVADLVENRRTAKKVQDLKNKETQEVSAALKIQAEVDKGRRSAANAERLAKASFDQSVKKADDAVSLLERSLDSALQETGKVNSRTVKALRKSLAGAKEARSDIQLKGYATDLKGYATSPKALAEEKEAIRRLKVTRLKLAALIEAEQKKQLKPLLDDVALAETALADHLEHIEDLKGEIPSLRESNRSAQGAINMKVDAAKATAAREAKKEALHQARLKMEADTAHRNTQRQTLDDELASLQRQEHFILDYDAPQSADQILAHDLHTANENAKLGASEALQALEHRKSTARTAPVYGPDKENPFKAWRQGEGNTTPRAKQLNRQFEQASAEAKKLKPENPDIASGAEKAAYQDALDDAKTLEQELKRDYADYINKTNPAPESKIASRRDALKARKIRDGINEWIEGNPNTSPEIKGLLKRLVVQYEEEAAFKYTADKFPRHEAKRAAYVEKALEKLDVLKSGEGSAREKLLNKLFSGDDTGLGNSIREAYDTNQPLDIASNRASILQAIRKLPKGEQDEATALLARVDLDTRPTPYKPSAVKGGEVLTSEDFEEAVKQMEYEDDMGVLFGLERMWGMKAALGHKKAARIRQALIGKGKGGAQMSSPLTRKHAKAIAAYEHVQENSLKHIARILGIDAKDLDAKTLLSDPRAQQVVNAFKWIQKDLKAFRGTRYENDLNLVYLTMIDQLNGSDYFNKTIWKAEAMKRKDFYDALTTAQGAPPESRNIDYRGTAAIGDELGPIGDPIPFEDLQYNPITDPKGVRERSRVDESGITPLVDLGKKGAHKQSKENVLERSAQTAEAQSRLNEGAEGLPPMDQFAPDDLDIRFTEKAEVGFQESISTMMKQFGGIPDQLTGMEGAIPTNMNPLQTSVASVNDFRAKAKQQRKWARDIVPGAVDKRAKKLNLTDQDGKIKHIKNSRDFQTLDGMLTSSNDMLAKLLGGMEYDPTKSLRSFKGLEGEQIWHTSDGSMTKYIAIRKQVLNSKAIRETMRDGEISQDTFRALSLYEIDLSKGDRGFKASALDIAEVLYPEKVLRNPVLDMNIGEDWYERALGAKGHTSTNLDRDVSTFDLARQIIQDQGPDGLTSRLDEVGKVYVNDTLDSILAHGELLKRSERIEEFRVYDAKQGGEMNSTRNSKQTDPSIEDLDNPDMVMENMDMAEPSLNLDSPNEI